MRRALLTLILLLLLAVGGTACGSGNGIESPSSSGDSAIEEAPEEEVEEEGPEEEVPEQIDEPSIEEVPEEGSSAPEEPTPEETDEEELERLEELLASVPLPELCTTEEPDYTPLADLEVEDVELPPDLRERLQEIHPNLAVIRQRYVNEKQQPFELTIFAADGGILEEYLASARVCFEAFEQVEGEEEEHLTGTYDDLAVGTDPEMTSSAPFEDDPPPGGDLDLESLLTQIDGRMTIIVFFERSEVRVPQESREVVHFAIDPDIGLNEWHGYRAICDSAAWAILRADMGGARLYMWQSSPYAFVGSQEVSTPDWTSWLGGIMADAVSWDISVRGLESSNTYEVFGGWERGSGGGC